jgi:hypothetical protein
MQLACARCRLVTMCATHWTGCFHAVTPWCVGGLCSGGARCRWCCGTGGVALRAHSMREGLGAWRVGVSKERGFGLLHGFATRRG